MTTNQVYTVVNSLNDQSQGKIPITVTDTASLISYGDLVLSSKDMTDIWLNGLCLRIFKDIIVNRAYRNRMADLVKGEGEMGAIVRKIRTDMPDAEKDESVKLTDGEWVNHWVIANPIALQYLFAKRTPYQFHRTIQRRWLKEAFLSEAAMEQFIAAVYQQIDNKIELTIENLTKAALSNFAALCSTDGREVKLVTNYNASRAAGATALNPGPSALNDPAFLRHANQVVGMVASAMEDMSVLYNHEKVSTFTPAARRKFYTLSRFDKAMETILLADTYHDNYLTMASHRSLPYWQGTNVNPFDWTASAKINVNLQTPGTTETSGVELDNVVGVMFDTDALGAYRAVEDVQTTPLNAAGLYYNVYYHLQELWFNATDENGVVFTLN